ncbi:hypothetical protein N7510_011716 [Penicillium lagena]|uniref:uncharacterized protein n=1 Tax=Penicillium lagena TaxID=94218 RepID=UPI0025407E36|nr:uncharacterized protein N7510_011716 [Penicillium lagena]KAJ5602182.1 hypothetical protein N7510_011716 [Penicillium lagena]
MTAMLAQHDQSSRFSSNPLRLPTAQRYFLEDLSPKPPMPHHDSPRECPSPVTSTLSSIPPSPDTTLSSLSLEDEDLLLPSYDEGRTAKEPVFDELPSASPAPWPVHSPAADDTSIEQEPPSRHVDYLSHDWAEEDIWASWRYVTSRKDKYSNGVRLENASWRTWTKTKDKIGTVSPETLNWLKDCDVTWLYGPLKTSTSSTTVSGLSPPPSLHTPRPILKKKTVSETILQRSLSQNTLLKHASAILKAQEAEHSRTRPPFGRSNTDIEQFRTGSSTDSQSDTRTTATSSGVTSPSERRHIHFNNEVVQCIAVEVKGGDDDGADWPATVDDESSSDDGVVMMRQSAPSKASTSNRSTPRNSFSGEGKTIALLPSTTLKYREDPPEPRESIFDRWAAQPSSSPSLSPTPSVETLRPSRPSANFLLDDEEDDSLDFTGQYGSAADYYRDRPWFAPEEDTDLNRPLSSSRFMPEGDGEATSASLMDRVVDSINGARDIAFVIWNVGWAR